MDRQREAEHSRLLRHTEEHESPFIGMLKEVAEDPIGTIDLWSDNRKDIVRAHSGASRDSATLAYVDALEEETC